MLYGDVSSVLCVHTGRRAQWCCVNVAAPSPSGGALDPWIWQGDTVFSLNQKATLYYFKFDRIIF